MKLTTNQVEAINFLKGNLQIIACAGSGKTQTISRRVANLVLTGIPKEQILAFTFTDKAANEMKLRIRKQLEELLPQNPELGSMYIGTIHSFCFQYLKEIRPEYRNYDIIDQNKQLLFLSRHFNDIGLQQLRVGRENMFLIMQRFVKTVDVVKQNRISEKSIEKDSPDFFKCYIYYMRLMDEHKFIDFASIIVNLVNLLESEEKELTAIKEKIKFVVVDEYQDINPIQERLINLIAGANGNLCVVGDDDQAIFEFQGANVDNILTFNKRYKNVKPIKLLENFRSANAIIESARDLIQYNNTNGRLQKRMEHGSKFKISEKGDLYKIEFNNRADEVHFIANKIKELRGYSHLEKINEYGDPIYRGLDWCDFAILVRNNATARDFIDVFNSEEIPFTAQGTAGLFDRDEIRFIQMVFNFFCNMEIWNSGNTIPCDIASLKVFYKNQINNSDWNKIEYTIESLKVTIQNGDRFYPQEIYYKILNSMGIGNEIFDDGDLYDFGRFSELILDFETVNEWVNFHRLKSFVFYLNGYVETRIDLGGLDDPTKLNTVTIQSVHKAKGLEFPVVFIPDLSKGRFPSKNRNKLPDVYLKNVDLSRFTSGDAGERRLFYVAVTRSKKFLFLTTARDIGHKVYYNPSPYFDELNHDLFINRNIPDPVIRIKNAPTPQTSLEIIPTTFTDLQYYLKCPYDYLLRKLMGFSPTIDLSFGYGQQVHNLLNRIHTTNQDVVPSDSDIEKLTESDFFLRYTRGNIFDNMKNKAKSIIKNYVTSFGSDFPLKLETEKPFEFVLDDALISGQIDLITVVNPETKEIKDVKLIDFKTEKKEGRRERDPLNKLQLRLYAIAAGKALDLNPLMTSIHYLSDNVRIDVGVDNDKLIEARGVINQTVQGIKQRRFIKNCGKHCEECDFNLICSKK
jgi:DNA helicase II / ATP-dependent DNA helicase PcrA